MTNPVTPICLAPQGDVAPHSYVIQLEATRCTNCNMRKTHCHVYAKTHLRSRTGAKYVTNLRPVRGPKEIQWNVPIEPDIRPDTIIPFCEECFDRVELTHLPTPPAQTQTILNSHTDDTKAAKGGGAKAARDAKPKKTPTIDDLSF